MRRLSSAAARSPYAMQACGKGESEEGIDGRLLLLLQQQRIRRKRGRKWKWRREGASSAAAARARDTVMT